MAGVRPTLAIPGTEMDLACGELLITLDDAVHFIIEGESPDELPPQEELIKPGAYTMRITDAGLYTK